MKYEMHYRVTRNAGYGQVYARTYRDPDAAAHCLETWPREGLEHRHPSLRLCGEFTLRPVMVETRDNGAMFIVPAYS